MNRKDINSKFEIGSEFNNDNMKKISNKENISSEKMEYRSSDRTEIVRFPIPILRRQFNQDIENYVKNILDELPIGSFVLFSFSLVTELDKYNHSRLECQQVNDDNKNNENDKNDKNNENDKNDKNNENDKNDKNNENDKNNKNDKNDEYLYEIHVRRKGNNKDNIDNIEDTIEYCTWWRFYKTYKVPALGIYINNDKDRNDINDMDNVNNMDKIYKIANKYGRYRYHGKLDKLDELHTLHINKFHAHQLDNLIDNMQYKYEINESIPETFIEYDDENQLEFINSNHIDNNGNIYDVLFSDSDSFPINTNYCFIPF